MTQHFEQALPKPAAPKLTKYGAALTEAKLHLDHIPKYNRKAQQIQRDRIKYWEQLVAAERGDSWLQ